MKKKKVRKMWIILPMVFLVILLPILYLFTPVSFIGVKAEGEYQMRLNIDEHELTATMDDNTSSWALHHMLEHGSKTIDLRDYAGMEKVGMLWRGLPSNNEDLSTKAGDLVLFMGSSFVIYYNTNHYHFTHLGRINDVTQSELTEILGEGNVKVTLSLIQ